jgi:predicted transcriptional regulator
LDIIADILDASVEGVKKTHLMYHCNLSFRQMKAYSHFLLDRGFLQKVKLDPNTKDGRFEVTDRGKEFLKAYRGLKALLQ